MAQQVRGEHPFELLGTEPAKVRVVNHEAVVVPTDELVLQRWEEDRECHAGYQQW
jgi:hypothetical protein